MHRYNQTQFRLHFPTWCPKARSWSISQNLYFFHFFKEHYSLWSKSQNEAQSLDSGFLKVFGGGGRDRTDDLLLAKQALSQLSYTPDKDFGGSGWVRTIDPRLIKTVL